MNERVYIIFIFSFLLVKNVSSQSVYTTKTGKKYHRESCRFLKYSQKSITIEKAKEFGYLACKVCKPTLNNTKSSKKRKAKSNSSVERKKNQNKPRKIHIAKQCTGKTKSGRRCKRKTKNANGRCYQHQ